MKKINFVFDYEYKDYGISYLRIVSCFLVMFYHYNFYYGLNVQVDSTWNRIGVYIVPMFYTISGISLGLRYPSEYFTGTSSYLHYFQNRIYKIYPLYWFVCIIYLLFGSRNWTIYDIILNATCLFGFVGNERYIPTGGWSIGNEIVFYFFFPIIQLLNQLHLYFFFLFTILCSVFISFFYLDRNYSFEQQWSTYINPLNNFFFFVAGVLISKYKNKFHTKGLEKYLIGFLVIDIIFFLYIPYDESKIYIVTNLKRFVLSAATIIIVFIFSYFEVKKSIIISILSKLTYSIYLLHPIVYNALKLKISSNIYISAVLLTIVVSMGTYYVFEYKLFFYIKKKKKY